MEIAMKTSFLPGLVSVTFRSLTSHDIIKLCAENHLMGIEWGGDIHVPHGDILCAKEVGKMTRDAGLTVAAYGSYYEVGQSKADNLNFMRVLDTAIALEAPIIRVWAGNCGSTDADDSYRRMIIDESCRIAAIAEQAKLKVGFEFHGDTLTDSISSAIELLTMTAKSGLYCYWQPLVALSAIDRLESLRKILPYLANLHVYHWHDNSDRRPLAEGAKEWLSYINIAAKAPDDIGFQRWALLEFVRDNNPSQLVADAGELIRLLSELRTD